MHSISTGDAHPLRLPAYRIPHAYWNEVKKELREMLEGGIIEATSSPWCAPIVLRVDEHIDKIGQSRYLSALDLSKGYWQVPIEESSKPKTAFITPFGVYHFKVMPFGLQGAPATFQRLMDYVLRDLDEFAAAYLDDIVIYSQSWEEHLEHLRRVLCSLRQTRLTVKLRKCQLGMTECRYLGHIVGSGEVRPEQDKVRAIRKFPVPQTKKEVRVFLGIAGYYRKFIPNFSSVATALTDLTKRKAPNQVQWTKECDTAFQLLKQLLCSEPVLKTPDFDRPFILQTDASDHGVGAVLSQRDKDGIEHPLGYFSRKLLAREENYSTVEKECLAIKLGVETFCVYLIGRQFEIQTDHRALTWLDRLKETNARLTRWSLTLQPYSFTVVYRKGSMNGNADALSRGASNQLDAGEGGRSVKACPSK